MRPLQTVLLCASLTLTAHAATTFYVDGVGGKNTNNGTSPAAAWKDFTYINNRVLLPGDRLLIKRGSVINQELRLDARGTAAQWTEIGAYGEGARPILRRNRDVNDRCALVTNPDYLRIHSLAFSHAGKGLTVAFTEPGHGHLDISDCIAHHIAGIYRGDASGIPEWHFQPTLDETSASHQVSAGIRVVGWGRDITLRDCDVFQNSWGFFLMGSDIQINRIFCHHNFAFNTAPHPALVQTTNVVMQNCVFDASGYHAHAGTMGIMLVAPMNLVVRNCTFRNQPDSGCHDEGGIDFEAWGDGCVVENCTFQNNAGAGVEVLGLTRPQPKNVEIRHSRFIQNNWANKLGPSEIFIWGKKSSPTICCSSGSIHDNGCVLLPGVKFFTNQAPATTHWTLTNNAEFKSVAALDKAMPLNNPPVVSAGDTIISDRAEVKLRGNVSDDGRPRGQKLSARWELLEGPGTVAFKNPNAAKCDAAFSAPGDYLLRLVGDDGELWTGDLLTVHIVPRGVTVAKAWEFNTPLDKEGWADAELGTQVRTNFAADKPRTAANIACIVYPVHYVAGGDYILALENAAGAHLLSPAKLNVSLKQNKIVRLRLQNHTPAAQMTLRFITGADPFWDDAKSQSFAVTPNDNGPRDYAVDMSSVSGWSGKLQQLRLDLTGGATVTGAVRVDYIRIENTP